MCVCVGGGGGGGRGGGGGGLVVTNERTAQKQVKVGIVTKIKALIALVSQLSQECRLGKKT